MGYEWGMNIHSHHFSSIVIHCNELLSMIIHCHHSYLGVTTSTKMSIGFDPEEADVWGRKHHSAKPAKPLVHPWVKVDRSVAAFVATSGAHQQGK